MENKSAGKEDDHTQCYSIIKSFINLHAYFIH